MKIKMLFATLFAGIMLAAVPAAQAGRSNFIEYGYGDPAPSHCSGGPFSAPGCDAYLF